MCCATQTIKSFANAQELELVWLAMLQVYNITQLVQAVLFLWTT